jgi:hypothetical protein
MSPYLQLFFEKVWAWLVAPPLNWALSLSMEWRLEVIAAVLLVAFRYRLFEYFVIGHERADELWRERQRVREWYRYARMSGAKFQAVLKALDRKADTQDRLADRLEDRAGGPYSTGILAEAASRRRRRAEALRSEIRRLRELWREIENQRSECERKPPRSGLVLSLMKQLDSVDEQEAANALAMLNRCRAWFDLESLAPAEMPVAECRRLTQLLMLMAGTSSLGEARNAYHSALKIMRKHDLEWLWEAV